MVISIFFSATLARARTPNVYQRDTLLAKNGVTFYVSAIVGAEQRFRPQQHIGSSVGGDAIPADAPTRSLSQRRNSA